MSGEFTFTLPITLRKDTPAEPVAVVPPVVDPVESVVKPIAPDILEPVVPPVDTRSDEGIDLFGTGEPGTPEVPVDDFEYAATELELVLPEGVTKWTGKLIAEQAKAKIEDSRQYLNLDDYDPEITTLFKYIQENGGSLIGLATDPVIKDLNEITMFDPEFFYRTSMVVKLKEAGLSDSAAENQVEVLIDQMEESEREEFFEKYKLEKIRSEINPLINNRVSELNDEKESYRKKLELAQQGNSEKINKRMEQVVSDLVDMTGIEFSAKNKETVLARLKNGEIQKEIAKDPGYYQMLGYLHKQTDEKRTAIWKDLLQNQSKSQYHAGIKKVLDQAYGVDKGGGSQSSGEAKNDWTKLKTR